MEPELLHGDASELIMHETHSALDDITRWEMSEAMEDMNKEGKYEIKE